MARNPTDTLTSNNATMTADGSNNGVSSQDHYSMAHGVTTSKAAADTAIQNTSTTLSVTGIIVVGCTFKLAAAGFPHSFGTVIA